MEIDETIEITGRKQIDSDKEWEIIVKEIDNIFWNMRTNLLYFLI